MSMKLMVVAGVVGVSAVGYGAYRLMTKEKGVQVLTEEDYETYVKDTHVIDGEATDVTGAAQAA